MEPSLSWDNFKQMPAYRHSGSGFQKDNMGDGIQNNNNSTGNQNNGAGQQYIVNNYTGTQTRSPAM